MTCLTLIRADDADMPRSISDPPQTPSVASGLSSTDDATRTPKTHKKSQLEVPSSALSTFGREGSDPGDDDALSQSVRTRD